MPTIVWGASKDPKHDQAVKAKIYTFLDKLSDDDTVPGLHIEPMQQPVDSRVRTGRVDIHWRAVLFKLEPMGGEPTYVYAGTWHHDEAIKRARTTCLSMNPVNGLAVFRQEVEAFDDVAELPAAVSPAVAAVPTASPLLSELGFFVTDLTGEFGFDPETAEAAFRMSDEEELLDFASGLDNAWQADVLVAMGAGTALHLIKSELRLDEPIVTDPTADDDTRLLEALRHPAAQMQFTFIDDTEELRRVIEGGDFGAWRVFLHPEQREHVEKSRKGSFRLTGGAGTGKTVVLLHRARQLARRNPDARIVLTTFTRALAENLRRDLERLDPDIRFASKLGAPGILVRGVDQIASDIRALAGGNSYGDVALQVIGSTRDSTAIAAEMDWKSALHEVGDALPVSLRSEAFFEGEYTQVVLPHGVHDLDDYLTVRRPGRRVALDRSRRTAVWGVIEQARKNHRIAGALSFAEVAAVSAEWLRDSERNVADHVLVDEAQDLVPSKWQLLRALVAEGPDDLFIADDTHQRIYGQTIVLKRYGIAVRGRSRRLTLNYRTTLENLRYAMGILAGVEYEDSEAKGVTTDGYRSSRSGPRPATRSTKSDAGQFDAIAEDVKRWIDDGVKPETIAILSASNTASNKIQQALGQRGVAVALLNAPRITGGQPVAMTMHAAKGMEFSRVVLFDVSDGSFPPSVAYKGVPDEEKPDLDKRFRSLLYVAVSRARDELVVTWKGSPSHLLID
ncbi:UvrD-helicase domain-containing protein [Microbacterium sp. USHLN272]|uniref:UvrD-helicase domain-containing protein n=1 Tax=Microbacterium sp. USHLN272 TaxID=3081287 RepID=UPI0030165130